jgi:tetratricopeptide (TPR) repeat protein
MPRLSLCMIVKNEESMLRRCLESVKGCVDEMIVVDTGSQDKTKEIAREFHAKVYEHSWEHDFSKHQNQSVSHATGDWILQMDADEELEIKSGGVLREIIRNTDADAFMVSILSYFNQGRSFSRESKIRAFRKRESIFYEGIVHKQLKGCREVRVSPVIIHHYGYDLPPELQQKKFERTRSLLERQIASDPHNYWHRHNLAVCYASNSCFSEAVNEGMRAISLAEKHRSRGANLSWTHYVVAASLFKLGDLDQAEEVALKALGESESVDSHFVLILIYHQRKKWPELEHHIQEYLRISESMEKSPERFSGTITNMAGEKWRVRLARGEGFLQDGQLAPAQESFASALRETPFSSECLKRIGDSYKSHSFWEEAANHYQRALNEGEDSPEVLLGLAFCLNRLGRGREAVDFYQRVLSLNADCLEALTNVAEDCFSRGAETEAIEYYEKALSLDGRLVKPALRLSFLAAKRGEVEACVAYCSKILMALHLPCDHTLETVSDLAGLFLMIGHVFEKAGKEEMFLDAVKVALILNPGLLQ